ncbi:hypothetical protein ACJMK2_003185 [Sinanodonta woodiana]|uniref:Uncharacterized protein n=1 Tax=Sinanodonta woodiana TaxID=1069815 RepID=A0ABD3XXF5_SINWO
MRVSMGRATSIEGLQILNYNPKAAHLKHLQGVYDIGCYVGVEKKEDISCCKSQCTPEMQDDDNYCTMSHRCAYAGHTDVPMQIRKQKQKLKDRNVQGVLVV